MLLWETLERAVSQSVSKSFLGPSYGSEIPMDPDHLHDLSK